MVRETGVQSEVESYQRLKKWYLMPPCLTPSIIRYGSRVKWSNPGKGVVPFLTLRCCSYWKGSPRVILDCSLELTFIFVLEENCQMSIYSYCTYFCGIFLKLFTYPKKRNTVGCTFLLYNEIHSIHYCWSRLLRMIQKCTTDSPKQLSLGFEYRVCLSP